MLYSSNNSLVALLALFLLAGLYIIFRFDGTADAGDSVQHFLIAHYAFEHPRLFFDHWGKPLFVLLSAPLAQLGFEGMKLFNLLVATLEALFVVLCARQLGYARSLLAGLFFIFAPFGFVLIFSGLTEHLFGLAIILATYGVLRGYLFWPVVLISFLPFVRSEGLVIIGAWGLYLLDRRKWKLLPLLFTGHLAYALAGARTHGSLLWVFNRIPYATPDSVYGHGRLLHFADQLFYVAGPVIYGLLVLGILSLFLQKEVRREEWFLLFGAFLAYFLAHSLFWYLGIFNSMGLKRVLVAVLPLAAMLAMRGFNLLLAWAEGRRWLQHSLLALILGGLVLFPFSSNKAAIDWQSSFSLQPGQQLAHEVAAYLESSFSPSPRSTFFFSHPYLSIALGIDYFDPEKRRELDPDALQLLKHGDIVIWDNWFAVVDKGVPLESLEDEYGLQRLQSFVKADRQFVILIK